MTVAAVARHGTIPAEQKDMRVMSDIPEQSANGSQDEGTLDSQPPGAAHAHTPEEREIAAIIFDSISDGVFTVDRNCRITALNRAAESISGFSREEAIGQYCFDIFRSDICQSRCALFLFDRFSSDIFWRMPAGAGDKVARELHGEEARV